LLDWLRDVPRDRRTEVVEQEVVTARVTMRNGSTERESVVEEEERRLMEMEEGGKSVIEPCHPAMRKRG
jgi:hypothetical protein